VDQSGQEIRPFPEVPEVLEYLVKEGYTLAAASRTNKPPGAFQLLEMLDWNKYFTFKEIYPGTKLVHFQRLEFVQVFSNRNSIFNWPKIQININDHFWLWLQMMYECIWVYEFYFINRFLEQSKLSYSSMMFFDDEERNIREVSTLGVKCVFVPNGINMNFIKETISLFEEGKL